MSADPVTQNCEICNGRGFTACSGCGMIICEKCSRFESTSFACIPPAFYCPACDKDPQVNPKAAPGDS
jgi:hypothetical protein